MFGYGGAFLGSLANAATFPPTLTDDVLSGTLRTVVIASFASLVSQLGWFGVTTSLRAKFAIWFGGALVGALGVWVALAISSAVLDNPDLYMLNRDVSGFGLLGATVGCNLVAVAFTVFAIRRDGYSLQ